MDSPLIIYHPDDNLVGPRPAFETYRPFFYGFGIERNPFQHDSPDETAVYHPAGLAEDDVGVGVLLVHRVEAGGPGLVHHEGLQGLAAAGQGDRRYLESGANENTNGLIRKYIPRGTDFSELTDGMLAEIEWKLNHRPRKSLGYRTPLEYCKQLFNFGF